MDLKLLVNQLTYMLYNILKLHIMSYCEMLKYWSNGNIDIIYI